MCIRDRRRAEERRLAVVLVPGVPDQEQRGGEHHPEDAAANVGHGEAVSDAPEAREEGAAGEAASRARKRRGGSAGTGSKPPAHHGWQRPMRPTVKALPARAPWRCKASMA